MTKTILESTVIHELFKPETRLETRIFNDKSWQIGLEWGKPRKGHPEGKVKYHIREVLDNVEKVIEDDLMRYRLRLVTLIHDTFKYKEDLSFPRNWDKHHAALARQFAEYYVKDETVLDLIELHDEAYYCWRWQHRFNKPEIAQQRLNNLLKRIGQKNLQLYYLFFKCDTQTGDKTQEPVDWFEQSFDIEIVNF